MRWTKPPTNPAFLHPRDRKQARAALGLPAEGTVIAVSGGGWGVGDVIGAARAALDVEGAEVLCLCGHNEGLKDRVTAHFGGDPRLHVMGFTNRMGDVMAASNALIHSSAGLTVLEAIIRGCPVISYGFGYGHVRVSNQALERFKLAQVARTEEQLKPALEHALTLAPEPDGSFAKRASTASLILSDERRVQPLPSWRVRTVRTATALGATAVVALGAFTWSFVYNVVGAVAHTTVTGVPIAKRDVGVIVDASAGQVPQLAAATADSGLQVSFAVEECTRVARYVAAAYQDEVVPRLPDSGLIGWTHTKRDLHRCLHELGDDSHHFVYASSGSSLIQWIIAHDSGGLHVAGKVEISSVSQIPSKLHNGEVVEIRGGSAHDELRLLRALDEQMHDQGTKGVKVTSLLKSSGTSI